MFNRLTALFSGKKQEVSFVLRILYLSPRRMFLFLNIVMDNAPIATLFYDKNEKKYGLIYHEKYKNYKGLLPFNIDLPRDQSVKIGKPYYNVKLWYPFSARLPSKNRRDCIEKLKEHNLTLNDHPLKILDCIGQISIANRWKLEPYRL